MEAARKLAYYNSAQGFDVLAPRGWYCFGTYGSGGHALFVRPQPIDKATLFSTGRSGFTGPAIEISQSYGDTSGRLVVAEMIGRVCPAYKAFVTHVMEALDLQASYFPAGPYPTDLLLLAVRLPPDVDSLKRVTIGQVEREAARGPDN